MNVGVMTKGIFLFSKLTEQVVSLVKKVMLRQSEKARVRMFTALIYIGRTLVATVLFKMFSHRFFFDKKYDDPKVLKGINKAVEEEFGWVKTIPSIFKIVFEFLNK